MLIKKLMPCLITAVLILPVLSFSQIQEIKEYTVQKGDTLWDISHTELQDPFLWPKIWKENPEIANPDRIYPDQSIKIPLYLLQKELKEEPISEPVVEKAPEPLKEEVKAEPAPVPVKIKPLVDKKLYLASGYITDAMGAAGKITGSPEGRSLFGNNDLVYITTDSSLNTGDKFYIIRRGQEVTHPLTNQKMGYIADILGVAEVKKFEYGETIAKILVSFKEVITGDFIDTFAAVNIMRYPAMEPPVVSKPYRKPNIDGYIVAARNLRLLNSAHDIVYIDKGQKDGLEAGDILKTVVIGTHKVPNGTIQIISLNDNTATAVVISNTDAVTVGNWVTQAE